MKFSNLYQELEKKFCLVLYQNFFQSETDFKKKVMSTQQNSSHSLYCHFQDKDVILTPEIVYLMNDMREQGLILNDDLNLNDRGKERIGYLYELEDENKIILSDTDPVFPAEIRKEVNINSYSISFITEFNRETYDLIWSLPLRYDFYCLFNFIPKESYLSLVTEKTKVKAFCIDSGSLIFKTNLDIEKKHLDKNYKMLCNFYFSMTRNRNFQAVIHEFITFLLSSGLRYTIADYDLDKFIPRFGENLRDIAQKDEPREQYSFRRYSLEHSILKDWSRGKLHELYFYRILIQSNYFDFVIPCVNAVKINDKTDSYTEESDIIASKDSKIYVFELKRSDRKNSIKRGLSQIHNRIEFFENQGFDCKGFIVTLENRKFHTFRGIEIRNITPIEVQDMIENSAIDSMLN